MRILPLIAVALAGCSGPDPAEGGAAANLVVEEVPIAEGDAPPQADEAPDLSGRWLGVEGMVLVVTPAATPGRYRLDMQYDLDNRTMVEGRIDGTAIAFERGGETLTLRPTDGAATGLKYLAAKKDCLTVKPGEGYCRD